MNGVIHEIKKGKGLAQPIEDIKFFSPMVISMIRIGEESGEMEKTLGKCADFYDDEVEVSLERLTALMEPAIMLVLACVVVYIVLSILYPMFTIYQNMG
jgi:type IV pilus assembly protein PilC